MSDLSSYLVKTCPKTVYYIPNYITEQEESDLLKNIYSVPKPKWTCLKNRRLQDWGGVPHEKGMIQETIPTWLWDYMNKVSNLKIYGNKIANHVLVNEYLPGQGIMPHLDGNLFYPTIATISCGSYTILEFCETNRTKLCNLLLERRSLVVIQDDMYNKYLHSISEVCEDEIGDCVNLNSCNYACDTLKRETRISLTIRHVPKVCKLKLNLITK